MNKTTLEVGDVVIADVIGEGFYEIHSFGETFVNVKLLKLFGKGWKWRGHISNCHNYPNPVDWSKWLGLKKVKSAQ